MLDSSDRLSQDLILWLNKFESAMRVRENLQGCVDLHIGYLQRLLKSQIAPYPPFDEEVLLGSDGHAYGKKYLLLFLAAEEEPDRRRSPLSPGNPARFTVTKHYVAEEFVTWLNNRGSLLRCRELEADYETLRQAGKLPPLPFPPPPGSVDEEAEMQRFLERMENLPGLARQRAVPDLQGAANNHAEEDRRIRQLEAGQNNAEQALQHGLDRLQNGVRAGEALGQEIGNQAADQRLQVDEANEDIEIARLIAQIENLPNLARQRMAPAMQEAANNHAKENRRMDRIEEAHNNAARILQREIDRLQNEIRVHRERGLEIDHQLEDLQQRYEEAERVNLEVQRGIHALEEAVKRKEKDSMGGFFQFGGDFLISLGATLLLSYFVPGASLAPWKNGGHLLRYTKVI